MALENQNVCKSAGEVDPLMPGAQIQIAPGMEDRSANQPSPSPYRTAPDGQFIGDTTFKQTASAVPRTCGRSVLDAIARTIQLVSETTVNVFCAPLETGAASTARPSRIATTTMRFMAFLLFIRLSREAD